MGGGGSMFILAAENSKKKEKVGNTTQIQGANYPEDKIIHSITAVVNDCFCYVLLILLCRATLNTWANTRQ